MAYKFEPISIVGRDQGSRLAVSMLFGLLLCGIVAAGVWYTTATEADAAVNTSNQTIAE